MNRQCISMKSDGVEPSKIKRACEYIFEYLAKEEFTLIETKYLMSSMGHIMCDMVKDDPLRKIAEFNYLSSVTNSLSCCASSNTTS